MSKPCITIELLRSDPKHDAFVRRIRELDLAILRGFGFKKKGPTSNDVPGRTTPPL